MTDQRSVTQNPVGDAERRFFGAEGKHLAVAARRERERTARREAILDAAEELVVSDGYHGLRMDAVAEAVELSKGTLYLYFANKDALCAAVATDRRPEMGSMGEPRAYHPPNADSD